MSAPPVANRVSIAASEEWIPPGFVLLLERCLVLGLCRKQPQRQCSQRSEQMIELDEKKRIIQEFVPGKQVTLAHVIANPDETLYTKLGLIDANGAIGILTITPSEGAMIAADVATKAADVQIGFVDRFNGSLVITGDVAAVEAAIRDVMRVLCDMMGFSSAPVTKT